MAAPSSFRPFIPASESPKELSIRALALGGFFGILFGAVTVYVGLKAGLTVAASIPISVLSISILRIFGRSTILENNIVQTAGNAGQSIASGVIFTLPALVFLGFDLEGFRIFALALFGGWLGVLFMIPLRRQLIVDEHETLLYPEGTACAEVLKAGERGGSFASRVFMGLGFGALYTLFQNEGLTKLFPSTPNWQFNFDPNGQQIMKGRGHSSGRDAGVHGCRLHYWHSNGGRDARGWRVQLAGADARHRIFWQTSSGTTVSRDYTDQPDGSECGSGRLTSGQWARVPWRRVVSSHCCVPLQQS